MKQSLYNGTVTVELNEGSHCYSVDYTDAKPDGVTTILGLVPKYLLPWVARTTADYFRDGILNRLAGEGSIEPTFLATLHEEAKKEHTRKRDRAGDIGTLVHAYAEEVIAGGDLEIWDAPPEAQPGCEAFQSWWFSLGQREEIQSERIVLSRKMFYCGKTDLVAKIDGRLSVVDFKTGSGFYEDQPLQLAAYAYALDEELGTEITDGWIIHLDKETGKCTPYFVEITPELKRDWEAVRVAWRAIKRNQERHKQIRKESKWKGRTSANTTAAEAAAL